ncbi:MFS transporter [Ktedonospora formicarum]|uniref:MFS transporter n=1 Tax=Ktedonospora formicarum TaxID=2778364 RepID=A0A8J3I2M1_9CHLR|nr:MFS transporter [Ktedonospora formicarum]GHO48947.1 MFS transporter [Ktedonospora formicarum]
MQQRKYRWWGIIALGVSIFLVTTDMTIVALALPSIAQYFHLSDSAVSTIVLSYSLPVTLLVLPVGMVLHRPYPLSAFAGSVVGFGLGSILCGLAPNFWILLLGRMVQGVAGSVMMTQNLAVATALAAPSERGRAIGIMSSLATLGSVTGPGIGGLLLGRFGWPSIFFVNVPMCLLAVLLGCVGLRGLTLAEGRTSSNGWRLMINLLRRPSFFWAWLVILMSSVVSGAFYTLLPFDLSRVQRLSPGTAGLVLLCLPFGIAVTAPISGYLTDRLGAKVLMMIGLAFMVGSVGVLTLAVGTRVSALDLALCLLLVGITRGIFDGPTQTLLMSSDSRETLSAASSLSAMGRNLGLALGPLLMSFTWLWMTGLVLQMVGGLLVLDLLTILGFLCGWLSLRAKAQFPVEALKVDHEGYHGQNTHSRTVIL